LPDRSGHERQVGPLYEWGVIRAKSVQDGKTEEQSIFAKATHVSGLLAHSATFPIGCRQNDAQPTALELRWQYFPVKRSASWPFKPANK
jgi:hypothetical protein